MHRHVAADAVVAAQWQIYKASTLIYDTGTDATNLSSLTVPTGTLIAGNSYSWQVRYEDNYGGWSNYSTPTAFAIAPVPEPGAIGFISGALMLSMRRRRSSTLQA